MGTKLIGQQVWYYYLVCLVYKLPIITLLVIVVAVFCYIINRKQYKFISNEVYLLLPAAIFLVTMSLGNHMYLGVRNIILILPLLFIFCGTLVKYIASSYAYLLVILLTITQVIHSANFFPHFLPYTNWLVTNKSNAYLIFADSNLYYQERNFILQKYLKANPNVQYEPITYTKGKVLVSIENYDDWWYDGKLKWLINLHLTPVNNLDSQYLLFDVP